jgi:hypothetical protein
MLTLILLSLFYKKPEQGAEKMFLRYGEERNRRKDKMFLEEAFISKFICCR